MYAAVDRPRYPLNRSVAVLNKSIDSGFVLEYMPFLSLYKVFSLTRTFKAYLSHDLLYPRLCNSYAVIISTSLSIISLLISFNFVMNKYSICILLKFIIKQCFQSTFT